MLTPFEAKDVEGVMQILPKKSPQGYTRLKFDADDKSKI